MHPSGCFHFPSGQVVIISHCPSRQVVVISHSYVAGGTILVNWEAVQLWMFRVPDPGTMAHCPRIDNPGTMKKYYYCPCFINPGTMKNSNAYIRKSSLQPCPQAKGNYTAYEGAAFLRQDDAPLRWNNVAFWQHNFHFPLGQDVITSQFLYLLIINISLLSKIVFWHLRVLKQF